MTLKYDIASCQGIEETCNLLGFKTKVKQMTLYDQINDGIKDAMRARDSIRLNTLRMLKSKILAVDARGNVPDNDVLKLFKTYLSNLEEAIGHTRNANKPEETETLEKEIAIVLEFLPKGLSRQETEQIIKQAIQDTGATSKKELGAVMKRAKELNSAIDGKTANEILSGLLI